ncbi:MAG: hypothetical protein ACP5QA_09940 [Phycisphaerae bacterium]
MFHNEKSTSVVPSNGTATTKSVASTPRSDKLVTMQEVQDAWKIWNLPMILSLKEAAEVIKIQPVRFCPVPLLPDSIPSKIPCRMA